MDVIWRTGIADRGDSGGPLLCNGKIAAVTSCHVDGSYPDCTRSEVYARVDNIATWIDAVEKKWELGALAGDAMTQPTNEASMDPSSQKIFAACVAVHRELGPGLYESVYQRCLVHELVKRAIDCTRDVALPLRYRGAVLTLTCRAALIVENRIVVGVKHVPQLLPSHDAEIQTQLHLGRMDTGILVNFNVVQLKDGWRRVTRVRSRPN